MIVAMSGQAVAMILGKYIRPYLIDDEKAMQRYIQTDRPNRDTSLLKPIPSVFEYGHRHVSEHAVGRSFNR